MRNTLGIIGVLTLAAVLTACASNEPLETAAAPAGRVAPVVQTDQAVLAAKIGAAGPGTTPLAWANPATGSAGVIEQIDAGDDASQCRTFVSTEHTLEGVARLSGLACPTTDAQWEIAHSGISVDLDDLRSHAMLISS